MQSRFEIGSMADDEEGQVDAEATFYFSLPSTTRASNGRWLKRAADADLGGQYDHLSDIASVIGRDLSESDTTTEKFHQTQHEGGNP